MAWNESLKSLTSPPFSLLQYLIFPFPSLGSKPLLLPLLFSVHLSAATAAKKPTPLPAFHSSLVISSLGMSHSKPTCEPPSVASNVTPPHPPF